MWSFSLYHAYWSRDHTNKKLETETRIYKLYMVSVLNYNCKKKSIPKQKSLQRPKSRINISDGLYNRQLFYVVHAFMQCLHGTSSVTDGHGTNVACLMLVSSIQVPSPTIVPVCSHQTKKDVRSFAGINKIKMFTSCHLWPCKRGPREYFI